MEAASVKKQIREKVRTRVSQITYEERNTYSASIAQRLNDEPLFSCADSVCVYLSMLSEPSTDAIIERCISLNKRVYVPVVVGEHMCFAAYDNTSSFTVSNLGVREPVDSKILECIHADIVVVPMLAFDSHCNRLGRGGGYYDRYLANVTVPIIGLAFDAQRVECVPMEAHDRALDMIITETGVYRK